VAAWIVQQLIKLSRVPIPVERTEGIRPPQDVPSIGKSRSAPEVLPMWVTRFTDAQRDALKLLIEAQGELGPSLAGAAEALDLARWDELPDAELPWEAVSTLATLQGIGEADVVWDLAAGGRIPVPQERRGTAPPT
jgi:hypothetical protein